MKIKISYILFVFFWTIDICKSDENVVNKVKNIVCTTDLIPMDGVYIYSDVKATIIGTEVTRSDIKSKVSGIYEDNILILPKSWDNNGLKINLMKHNNDLLEINYDGDHIIWKNTRNIL